MTAGTDGPGQVPRDTHGSGLGHRRKAAIAHRFTAAGLAGYVVLAAGVVLIVIALGAAAGGRGGVAWIAIAAAVVCVAGLGLLATARRSASALPPDAPRPEQDPLQPEVTVEDEESYESRFPRRESDPRNPPAS
ncbi:hypothetical protein V1Y59_21840 [Gordonia sp. PKS22-38]|uniref:Uncharacterized protein n=1 Tax=Gordonia prachuapensis TaxID=3115651 RepID=A0ABU7MZJ3_9ACTN|nr:hypothetical protein [Gordonia sp. PKS22-38]